MLIKNKGLHRIAILVGIISLLLVPEALNLTYLIFNADIYYWIQISASLGQGDYFALLLAIVFAFICFVAGYFLIKCIEWIYEGFKNN